MTNKEKAQIKSDTLQEIIDEMLLNSSSYIKDGGMGAFVVVRNYIDESGEMKVVKSELQLTAF